MENNYEGQSINTVESKYCSIMNVINESDIYSYIMPQKLGWSRYGMTCVKSEKEVDFLGRFWRDRTDRNKPIKNDRVLVESDMETIFNGRINTFRSSYYDNYDKKNIDEYIMHEIFKGMRNNTLDSVIQHIDRNEWTNDITRRNNYRVFAKHLKENNQAFKNARNLSVYYNISKSITPNDVTFRVSSDTTFRGYEASQDYKTAVRKMMEWYVSHVATYQHNHDNTWKETNGTLHTLYGSDEAEEYYDKYNLQNYVGRGGRNSYLYARDVELLKATNSNIILYKDFGGRGLYYCQSYTDRMNGRHQFVGDDCSGLAMAIYGYYAGEDLLKDIPKDLEDIGTSNIKDTSTYHNWLAKSAKIYAYQVTQSTTVNDLEFGDALITSGHLEFFIDNEHAWGWGFKHCSLYGDGNLGWKGKFTKDNINISFNILDRIVYVKDVNGNIKRKKKNDDRDYKVILSPNPNKRNMTPLFESEG